MGLKIAAALPRLLERRYPIVKPSYPLLTVLYLLRIQDLAAVPIADNGKGTRAIFGFSVLPQLMDLSSKALDQYLTGPCGAASEELGSFDMDDDVEDLLDSFEKTRLGVSLVNGRVTGEQRATLVSLADLVRLYRTKQFASDMTVDEVGSPFITLSRRTSVRDAVRTMFKLKVRRVFISGERVYISDRSILERVLSPATLVQTPGAKEMGVFDARIESLKKSPPIEVAPGSSLQSAASKLRSESGSCLTVQGKDVVLTPWDVIMKPWSADRLDLTTRASG
jgi:CBS domain-containing protein